MSAFWHSYEFVVFLIFRFAFSVKNHNLNLLSNGLSWLLITFLASLIQFSVNEWHYNSLTQLFLQPARTVEAYMVIPASRPAPQMSFTCTADSQRWCVAIAESPRQWAEARDSSQPPKNPSKAMRVVLSGSAAIPSTRGRRGPLMVAAPWGPQHQS